MNRHIYIQHNVAVTAPRQTGPGQQRLIGPMTFLLGFSSSLSDVEKRPQLPLSHFSDETRDHLPVKITCRVISLRKVLLTFFNSAVYQEILVVSFVGI